jgi:hypothetical protein
MPSWTHKPYSSSAARSSTPTADAAASTEALTQWLLPVAPDGAVHAVTSTFVAKSVLLAQPNPAVTPDAHIKAVMHACFIASVHQVLFGHLDYVPFPTLAMMQWLLPIAPNATVPAVTLFIGGIGLESPELQVATLVTMLTGVRVLGVPQIVKNGRNASVGARVRVPAQYADKVIATLHHRVLIDDKGVFFAATRAQLELLGPSSARCWRSARSSAAKCARTASSASWL